MQLHCSDADISTHRRQNKGYGARTCGVAHLRVGGVASLQNGVVKNEQIARVFGQEKVIGSTTMIGATLMRDGEVEYTLDGVTFFGDLGRHQSDRVSFIVDAFVRSGLKAAAADDIVSIEWTKQAFQNPFAPLSAITRLPVHLVWSSPQLLQCRYTCSAK